MKTFTVRDLNRSSTLVLAAAERDGLALVRGRDGRSFEVRPRAKVAKKPAWSSFIERRRRRLKELFPDGPIMTQEQAKEFDRLLADDGRLL